jgi:hypothetical protein
MAKRKLSPKTTSTSTIATSFLHERLARLQEQHKWLLKQIKRKRTEVSNFVEQMRSIALEMFERTAPIYQKSSNLDRQVHDLFGEIFAATKWSKKNKQKLEDIYEMLQDAGLISYRIEDDQNDEDRQLDELFEFDEEEINEFHEEQSRRYYQQQREENNYSFEELETKKTSKNIRHIFLRLAEKFHPDKVTDAETQNRHTEIMKELNRAYREGDLARLLEIEKNHQSEEIFLAKNEDDQTRQCQRLEHENEILKTQYEHLKHELRLAKNTPEGEIVKEYRKAKREGIDMIAEFIKAIEKEVEALEKIRDFVLSFKNKKISLKEFLKGPTLGRKMTERERQAMMDEIFEELIFRMNF